MSFFEDNIFEVLSKYDLEEDLAPEIDGDMVLYEDAEFSKTPAEADNYRSEAEEVLGFELNGNQVQYLATNWAEFYRNAKDCEDMRDLIIKKMDHNKGTELTDKQREVMEEAEMAEHPIEHIDDDDDIDYYEENPEALHPVMNAGPINPMDPADLHPEVPGNGPLKVQSWEDVPANKPEANNTVDELMSMGNELVGDDADDDIDPEKINAILNKE